ncbi:MAG: ThiF family adenylyltransferase [bacterium]|nr:ThiF family adenylyltransferase [bacterium]
MRVTIIGVGGIGSNLADWIAQFLASQPHPSTFTLTLVDGDVFEPPNIERQSFRRIGPKATVKAEELREKFPKLQIDALAEYITPENAAFILLPEEVVLLCVDNHKTRKLVSDEAGHVDNIVVISGGNDAAIGNGMIYVRKDGKDCTPPFTQDHPEISEPRDRAPYEMSCQELAESGVPQIFFANLNAAIGMANAFWRWLKDPEKFLSEKLGDLEVETAYTEFWFDMYRNTCMSRRVVPAPHIAERSETA